MRGSLRRGQVSLVQSVGFRGKYWRILLSAMKRRHQASGGADKRGVFYLPLCVSCVLGDEDLRRDGAEGVAAEGCRLTDRL